MGQVWVFSHLGKSWGWLESCVCNVAILPFDQCAMGPLCHSCFVIPQLGHVCSKKHCGPLHMMSHFIEWHTFSPRGVTQGHMLDKAVVFLVT